MPPPPQKSNGSRSVGVPKNPLSKKLKGKRGFPKRIRVLKRSTYMKRWLLNNPWIRPLSIFNYAAIIIQRVFRGQLTRFVMKGRVQFPPTTVSSKLKSNATMRLNAQLDRYLAKLDKYKGSSMKPQWMDGGYSGWCASRIQATWRMRKPYRRLRRTKHFVNQIAAIIIQSCARNYILRKGGLLSSNLATKGMKQMSVVEMRNFAVHRIQHCWRAFCNRRVYRFFRDLIKFKLKGAPYDLMRSIIPNEACLLDRAAGVHVRFRLGGVIFPPKIYFKIYTHRPLCDVNSFAPRNYSEEKSADEIQTLQVHAKHTTKPNVVAPTLRVGTKYFGAKVNTSVDMQNWYRREEKNPWRPIASQALEDKFAPPWLKRTLNLKKPQSFHFSSQKRKDEKIKAQKAKRRQWMLKAYLLASGKETEDIQDKDIYIIDEIQNRLAEAGKINLNLAKSEKDSGLHRSNNNINSKKKVFERVIQSSKVAMDDSNKFNDSQSLSSYNGEDLSSATSNHTYFLEPRKPMQNFQELNSDDNHQQLVDETNPEDLVKWSMALDYDSYSTDWLKYATSMPSDVDYKKIYLKSVEHSDDVKALYAKI